MRGDCKVQGVLGCSSFFRVIRSSENFLGALGENLGLAGVVLLLNRRDEKRILVLLLCELTDLCQGQGTYSEGGTHEADTASSKQGKGWKKR